MGPKKPAGKASAAADASSGQPFQRPLYTISILKSGDPFGTLIMELAVDALPKTTENFKQLAAGVTVGDKKNPKTASYKGCRFLRLTDDGLQTGDALHKEDGKGNDSIYGPMFEDEAFGVYPHVFGTVSMCNSGPNTNGSQFFFCTAPRRSATATSSVSPPSLTQARTSPDQDPSASSSPAPGSIAAPNNNNGNQPAAAVVMSHLDSRCVSFGKIMEGSEDVLQRLIDELRPFVSTSLSTSPGGQGGAVVADKDEGGVVSFEDGPTVGTIVPNAPFTIGSISPLS